MFDFQQLQKASVLQNALTVTGTVPAAFSIDTGFIPFGVKRSEREANHCPLFNAKINKGRISTPICLRESLHLLYMFLGFFLITTNLLHVL
jgi:hypothetical protein